MTRFARPAALAAATLVALTGSGCAITNPPLTQQQYAASDGAEARFDDVVVANAMFIASGEDAPGTLVTRVVNGGLEPVEVGLLSEQLGLELDVTVEPGQTVDVGPQGGEQAIIDPMGHVPGTRVPVVVVVDGAQQAEGMLVPVLDGTLEEYADLVPEQTS